MSAARQPLSRPASATHAAVAWSGVTCMLLAVTALNFWAPVHQIAYLALIVMAATALGVFVPDLLWQRVQQRGDAADRSRRKFSEINKFRARTNGVAELDLFEEIQHCSDYRVTYVKAE